MQTEHQTRRHDAQDVRQGRIVLNTRARRRIFFAGLAAVVLAGLIGAVAAA